MEVTVGSACENLFVNIILGIALYSVTLLTPV